MRSRPASSADIPALLAIQKRRPNLPQWTEAHFAEELRSPRAKVFVLEEGPALAGYAGLVVIPPEAQVSVIAVSPDHERKGLGRELLAGLIAHAKENDCATVTLEVSSGNAAALALYRRAGFTVVGRRAKFYNDGSDAVLMDLNL